MVDMRDGDVPAMDLRNVPLGHMPNPEATVNAYRMFGNVPPTWLKRGGPNSRLDDRHDGEAAHGWRTDLDATEHLACRRSNGDHSLLTLLGRFIRKLPKLRIKIWRSSAIDKERKERPRHGFVDPRFNDVQFLYEQTGQWCKDFY